jgi:hypothetical protein
MGANADSVAFSYVEEVTFGQVPPGPPTLNLTRLVSESFQQETDSAQSNEIDPGRQVVGVFRSNVRATGDLSYEFS